MEIYIVCHILLYKSFNNKNELLDYDYATYPLNRIYAFLSIVLSSIYSYFGRECTNFFILIYKTTLNRKELELTFPLKVCSEFGNFVITLIVK